MKRLAASFLAALLASLALWPPPGTASPPTAGPVRVDGDGGVVVYEPSTRQSHLLAATPVFEWRPGTNEAAISIDGRLAFFDAATGTITTTKVPITPHQLSEWSPDGSQFAFEYWDGRVVRVKLYDRATGTVRPITRGEGGTYGGSAWSPDGAFLVTHRGRGLVFTHLPGETNRVRTACDHNASVVAWPADDRVLCVREGRPGRVVVRLIEMRPTSSDVVKSLRVPAQDVSVAPVRGLVALFSGKTLTFYDAATLDPVFSTRQVTPFRQGKSRILVPLVWSPGGTLIAQAGENVVAAHRVGPRSVSRALALMSDTQSVGWNGEGTHFLACQRRFVGISPGGGVDVDLPQWERGAWSPDHEFSAWVPYGRFNQDNQVRVARTDGSVVRTALVTRYVPHVIGWSDDSRFLAAGASKPKENGEWYPEACKIVRPWPRDPHFKPGMAVVVTGADPALVRIRPGNAAPIARAVEAGATLTLTHGPLVVDGLRWWAVEEGGWLPDAAFAPAPGG